MAKVSTHDLKDMLECSICLEEYSDPRMLPCIHTFCFKCLERTGQDKQPGDIMACPLCRKEFKILENGIGGIPKNFFMESLVNMQHLSRVETKVFCDACLEDSVDDHPPAVLFCIECKQRLCDDCCKAHRKVKVLKQHQLINLGDKDGIEQLTRNSIQSFCSHHENEPIKMYCFDCKLVNCLECLVECHQGHKCSSVGKVSEEFKLKLGASTAIISSCFGKCEEEMLQLDEENRMIFEKSKSLESDVLKRAAYIKDIVDQHTNKLLTKIGTKKTAKLKEIETKKEEVSRQMAMLESYKRYAAEMVEKGSHVDICRHFEDMKTRSDELENNRNISHGPASDNIGAFAYTFIPSQIDDFLESTENVIGKVSESLADIEKKLENENCPFLVLPDGVRKAEDPRNGMKNSVSGDSGFEEILLGEPMWKFIRFKFPDIFETIEGKKDKRYASVGNEIRVKDSKDGIRKLEDWLTKHDIRNVETVKYETPSDVERDVFKKLTLHLAGRNPVVLVEFLSDKYFEVTGLRGDIETFKRALQRDISDHKISAKKMLASGPTRLSVDINRHHADIGKLSNMHDFKQSNAVSLNDEMMAYTPSNYTGSVASSSNHRSGAHGTPSNHYYSTRGSTSVAAGYQPTTLGSTPLRKNSSNSHGASSMSYYMGRQYDRSSKW